MTEEEDPYALSSSESEDEGPKKPIKIEGRSGDLKQLKSALFENKGPVKDEAREEELAALKQGNEELKKMKKDFETGAVHNIENEDEDTKIARLEERQKLTEIGQEKFSKFKTKFENIDSTMEEDLEQKLKRMQKEQIGGLGKETLASAKERFEKGESDSIVEKTAVDFERSADFSKMMTVQEMKQEEKKNCCICDKIVYSVEKVSEEFEEPVNAFQPISNQSMMSALFSLLEQMKEKNSRLRQQMSSVVEKVSDMDYTLHKVFSVMGPIKSIWMAKRPPGFAFVTFKRTAHAYDAVKYLNGKKICDLEAKVEMCEVDFREDLKRRTEENRQKLAN